MIRYHWQPGSFRAGIGQLKAGTARRRVAPIWENDPVPDSADFRLHAWVDESMRVHGVDEPMYLLGAAVADPAACGGVREELRALLPKGAPKLHWHQMDAREKNRSTGVVAPSTLFTSWSSQRR